VGHLQVFLTPSNAKNINKLVTLSFNMGLMKNESWKFGVHQQDNFSSHLHVPVHE
jgi:hypothetical protein